MNLQFAHRTLCFYSLVFSLSITALPSHLSAADANRHIKSLNQLKPEDIAAQSVPMANLEGEPSAFVGKHVNVITGDFNDFEVDLVVDGVDALTVERSFSGSTKTDGSLCAGWNLNIFGKLEPYRKNDSHEKQFVAVVSEGHGATSIFEKKLKKKDFSEAIDENVPLSPKMYKNGVTNTTSGYISGQTNIKNTKISYIGNKRYRIITGAGGYKEYEKSPGEDLQIDYRLSSEMKPSGNTLDYYYHRNKHHQRPKFHRYDILSSVEMKNKENNVTASLTYVTFKGSEFKKFPHHDVVSSDGRKVCYHFETREHDKRSEGCLLTKIERPNAPEESYTYIHGERDVGRLIRRKSWPEGRFIEAGYYKKGENRLGDKIINLKHGNNFRVNRVRVLRAPVGTDDTPIDIYHFGYRRIREDYKRPPVCSTVVLDALNHKTCYGYCFNHRLRLVEKYKDDGSVYSRERLYWGAADSEQSTYLLSRTLAFPDGILTFARAYQYDSFGNVLVDRICGNLTGENTIPPAVTPEGELIDFGCESYCKRFSYSANGRNQLLSEEDDGHKTVYQYCDDSNKIEAKFIGDHNTIYKRQFYEYNSDMALLKEIIDDGYTKDRNDLSGVTERHVIYYTPRQSFPVGVPEVIEEKFLDLKTGHEVLVHKTVNVYTNQGHLASQSHYDNTGALAYVLHWDYDAMGNVIREVDALSRETKRRFDANGNCIFEQGPNPYCHKEMTYDFANRLIKEEEIHADGMRRSVSYRYNVLSQMIASTDTYGNETLYSYDEFGRIIGTTYPQVLDGASNPFTPKQTNAYDLLSNVISTIDARGNETRMSYTIRGQVAHTIFTDGSEEKNIYNLDGSLKQKIAKNGTTTLYSYDALGRTIKTTIQSASGELLSETSSTYNGFHVVSETDPMGLQTLYNYFPDGKLKSKQCGKCLLEHSYDSLGRLNKTVEHYGDDASDVIVKVQEHDLLNRVIEERTEDSAGNILTQVNYSFDIDGHVCEMRSAEGHTTTTAYDSRGTPVVVTDAEGNQTWTCCRYDVVNSLGQCVPYTETTDPLGNVTATTADALGRTVLKVRKNAMGAITQKHELFYDAIGNCNRMIDTIINPDSSERQIVSSMSYDTSNRMIECVEAVGTPEQKRTAFHYNAFGQKSEHIKADGTIIHSSYDALGRLATLRSSDDTIHYAYCYDLRGNILKVDDLANNISTIKQYDEFGRLVKESLGNGLSLGYQYDNINRTTQVSLPDGSGIAYGYRASLFEKVQRIQVSGDVLYEHQYSQFNPSGRVTEMKLIGNAGSVKYEYDRLGRRVSTCSSHWKEVISKYDAAGNLLQRSVMDDDKFSLLNYTYDDLYQLKSEDDEKDGNSSHTYLYDSFYNRLMKDGKSHAVNNLNQLLDDGNVTFSYDPNGNLEQKSCGSHKTYFRYDALDRLVSFEDRSQKITYAYDEANRRLSKTVYKKNEIGEYTKQSKENYLYQGQNETGAVNEQGIITELRILGAGKGAEIGAAVAIELGSKNPKVYSPIHDHSGHVCCLIDSGTGEVADVYRYSSFGEELFENAICPWRFSSKRVDSESGLVYFGRRYYDPANGRWISQDPLGRDGGPNLYAYALNRPVIYSDPYGLHIVPDRWKNCPDPGFGRLGLAFNDSFKWFGDTWRKQCPIPIVRDIFSAGHHFINNGNFRNYRMEYQEKHSRNGQIYGLNLRPKVELVYVPGMNNTHESTTDGSQVLSRAHGDSSVSFTHNKDHGFISDLGETICQKLNIPTNSVDKFVALIREKLDKVGSDGIVMPYGFSQGGQIVDCLRNHLTADQLKQIIVVTLGSAKMISDKEFGGAINYVSTRDPVPFVSDPFGILKSFFCSDIHVEFIKSDGIPFMDHAFLNDTYQKAVADLGRRYIKEFLEGK